MSGDQPNALHPAVLWAQRNDCLYVTISIGDVKNKVLDLKEDSLNFKGKSGSPKPCDYAVNLEFYAPVIVEESRQLSTDREIVMYIKKQEPAFWPRLLKQTVKLPWLKTDFSRWRDEDDSEPEVDSNNFSSMLSQMSNFNDYGGDDGVDADLDSDDEDLPDLEPPAGDAEKPELNKAEKPEEEEDKAEAMKATA